MREDLNRYLPTFVLVAEELSFSAAARGLGLRLFHRSTHALTLTDEGERLQQKVGPLIEALDASLSAVKNVPSTPRGLLRVGAPYSVGKYHLLPLLDEFRKLYPQVELDLRFEDQIVDLVRHQIDVSISMRVDPNPALIGRKLYDTRTLVVASPRFLEQYGEPRRPRDLERLPCIRYRSAGSGRLLPWQFRDPDSGEAINLNPSAVINTTSLEIAADLALLHHGLAYTGLSSVDPHLRSGALVEVLAQYSYHLPPMMLYYTSKNDLPSRVEVFIEFLTRRLPSAHFSA
jgi:DNA-binding transcriptional LysR family regulator